MNNNGKDLDGIEESVSKTKDGQNNTQSLYSYQVYQKIVTSRNKKMILIHLLIKWQHTSLFLFRVP